MIDEVELWRLIDICVHLKYKFAGVYAADNFSPYIDCQSFLIVNSDKANQKGTPCVLLGRKKDDDLVFADPLGYLFTTSIYVTGYHLQILEGENLPGNPCRNYHQTYAESTVHIAHYILKWPLSHYTILE